MEILNTISWESLRDQFLSAKPFNHIIIDNFFTDEVAALLTSEFPDYEDDCWSCYDTALENKKTLNHWDRFQENIYRVMAFLNNQKFVDCIESLTGISDIQPDIGLNGAGLHLHKTGGKLNVHLDYSLHPKLKLERRLNIIIYLSDNWKGEWGGGLQLWSHDASKEQPLKCEKKIEVKFNRAVIFDTTQNSWHGLPEDLKCPEGIYRKSLAIYYLTEPRSHISERGKALFSPHGTQKDDQGILDLIKKRADLKTFDQSYRKSKQKI